MVEKPMYPEDQIQLEPGRLTALVNGGGMTNLAYAAPTLLSYAEKGHRIVVAAHEGRMSFEGMASPFDFISALSRTQHEALCELLDAEVRAPAQLKGLVETLLSGFEFADRAFPDERWMQLLERTEIDKPSLLYVPDLQVDLPQSDWIPRIGREALSDFELMPTQLVGLKALAARAKAIVIGGYCGGPESDSGARLVAQIADQTVMIDDERDLFTGDVHQAEIRVYTRFSGWSPTEVWPAAIDTRFLDWRPALRRAGDQAA
jgi:hypothetical protein